MEATAGFEPATFPIWTRNALTEVSLFFTAGGGGDGNRTRDLRIDNPLLHR